MLVVVKNVTLFDDIKGETSGSTGALTGRVSGHITPAAKGKVTNELIQLAGTPAGTKFTSITGIVTYFFDLHIAPRSQADLVPPSALASPPPSPPVPSTRRKTPSR